MTNMSVKSVLVLQHFSTTQMTQHVRMFYVFHLAQITGPDVSVQLALTLLGPYCWLRPILLTQVFMYIGGDSGETIIVCSCFLKRLISQFPPVSPCQDGSSRVTVVRKWLISQFPRVSPCQDGSFRVNF